MPGVGSSPTTRNGFEEQASGANTNTWGTLLNNTEQLIDDALDGVQSFALTTGGVTLTTSPYVTNQARMRVLLLTGTLTGAVPLTIPAIQKWYIVQNNTTGAFPVTIGATGNTQATCPQGRRTIVYCDGTNTFSNEIPLNLADAPTGDVSLAGHKLINLALATASTDAVSLANTIDQLAAAAADVNFNSHKLLNVATPVSATDGVNKSYADALITTNVITGFLATSTSAIAIGTGAKTLTVQTGKLYQAGQWVLAADHAAPTLNYMTGQVTAYNSATGVLAFTVFAGGTTGSGTPAQYDVSLSGSQGATGATGSPGTTLPVFERPSNTMLVLADSGKSFKITSGTFTQTFDTAVNLTSNWSAFYENAGTGIITVTTDGTTWKLYPGEQRQFYSDGSNLKSVCIRAGTVSDNTSGNFIVPPGWIGFDQDLLGGGGGGGGGLQHATGSGSAHNGGGGGGGGSRKIRRILLADTSLSAGGTVSYAIGAAGTAGAGGTSPTAGGNGGNTTFNGDTAYGGGGGDAGNVGFGTNGGAGAGGGAAAAGSGTAGTPAASADTTGIGSQGTKTASQAGVNSESGGATGGGETNNSATTAGGSALFGGAGGGGGGGCNASDVAVAASAGGAQGLMTTGGGGSAGATGANGASGIYGATGLGQGGGGGGAATGSTNGGNGGSGSPGCGGGGGGSQAGTGTAGNGGLGGSGKIIIKGF